MVYRRGDRGDRGFAPVEVKLGPSSLGRVVIASGIKTGDVLAHARSHPPGGSAAAQEDPERAAPGPGAPGRRDDHHPMTPQEALRSALDNLAAHKLRSALTMLGMIFGVGAVIAMMSIGAGAQRQALASIERLGLRNVLVRAKSFKDDELQEIRQKSLGVSSRDAAAIAEAVPGVEMVAPRIRIDPYKVLSATGKSDGAAVYGVGASHRDLAHLSVAEGRFLDEIDEARHAQVCVVGPAVRRDLFGYGPAVGQLVKVNDVWLEVVGVLADDGAPSAGGAGGDRAAAGRRGGGGRHHGARDLPAGLDRRAQVRASGPGLAPRRDRRAPEGRRERPGDLRAHPRAPGPPARRRRRLRAGGARGPAGREPAHPAAVQHGDGSHRRHLAPGGRHRHHEHHAGHGARTDARDRRPPRRGRAQPATSASSSSSSRSPSA